jgi:hypothetical protein
VKIYVVSGSTGEYSDRTDWMVRAYADEETAKAIVLEYTTKAKEIEVRCRLPKDDPQYINKYQGWRPEFKWPHPDPGFQMDYTGTDYFYGEIELVPSSHPETTR